MNDCQEFDVPILFILFNRPFHASRVFERIKAVRPSHLFIAIDGPRNGVPRDSENIVLCMKILDGIDWPCKVEKLIREENLGCKKAVSSAISWFFDKVEMGIILEDDCMPELTFFEFCKTLLHKYANQPKIMHIGGANTYGDTRWGSCSYFFSSIPHIWGWATWRRAWSLYDVNMQGYLEFRHSGELDKIVTYRPSRSFWRMVLDNTYSAKIDTWDYQWVFCIWKHKGLSIIPNQNLITNIGFGHEATHTLHDSEFADLPTVPIDVSNIVHPIEVVSNISATNYAFAKFYRLPSYWKRKFSRLKDILNLLN